MGIALAAFTLVTMPLLARAKLRVADALRSDAAAGEARQTMLCAYLSAALLAGLAANAVLGWWWADPLAALAIAGLAAREGRSAWLGGEGCCSMPDCGGELTDNARRPAAQTRTTSNPAKLLKSSS